MDAAPPPPPAEPTPRRPGALRAAARSFAGAWPAFLRYEIASRLLTGLVVLPLFSLVTAGLLATRGDSAVTNATLLPFLASWQGIVFVALLATLLAWAVVAELGGSITISALRRFDRPAAGFGAILRHSLRRAANLIGAGGLVVLAYLAVALPLTGAGLQVSFLQNLAVPRFIMAVIEADPRLFGGYAVVVLLLAGAAVLLSYTFPLVILGDLRAWPAVRTSVALVVRRPGVLFRHYLGPLLVASLLVSLLVVAWTSLVLGVLAGVGHQPRVFGILAAFLLLVQQAALLFGSMLWVPFQAQRLTDAYYAALPTDGPLAALRHAYPDIPPRRGSRLDRLTSRPGRLAVAFVVGILALAIPFGWVVNDLAHDRAEVTLVAHRAGGNGAPENSIAGLEYALAQRAGMVEIDVQRTRDDAYVLNHDDTFARVAGERRRVPDLTLAEVQSLRLTGTPERVPTLAEFLLAARGRMPVLVELKGATADRRMADDVMAIVDGLGMREQVVLMSLDYSLVRHIERTRPEYVTGFAYFLSIGDVSGLDGDIIMLEEGEATQERLDTIAGSGKKAYVWTVNDPGTIESLAATSASGIITDTIPEAREVLDRTRTFSSADVLRRLFGF